MKALREDNVRCLRRLRDLILRLSDAQYTRSVSPCDHGIGSHVRHVLDHYDAFFRGLSDGTVNYDVRARCEHTAMSREIACERINNICAALTNLSHVPESIGVIMDCGSDTSRCIASPSSGVRELQFLVSHTVHHDALIGAAANAMQVCADADYGLAPSTLQHLRQQKG